MSLTAEIHDYPNPDYKWAKILLDGTEVGQCEKTADGFMVRGGRKVYSLFGIAEVLLYNRLKVIRSELVAKQSEQKHVCDLLARLPNEATGHE